MSEAEAQVQVQVQPATTAPETAEGPPARFDQAKLIEIARARGAERNGGTSAKEEQSNEKEGQREGQGQGVLTDPESKPNEGEAPEVESKTEEDGESEVEKELTPEQKREFRKLKRAAEKEAKSELSGWTAKLRKTETEVRALKEEAEKVIAENKRLEELKKTNPLKWFEELNVDPHKLASEVIEREEKEDPRDAVIRKLEEKIDALTERLTEKSDQKSPETKEALRQEVAGKLAPHFSATKRDDYPYLHDFHTPEEVAAAASAKVLELVGKHGRDVTVAELHQIYTELDDEAEQLQERRTRARQAKEKKTAGASGQRDDKSKSQRDQKGEVAGADRRDTESSSDEPDTGRNYNRALRKLMSLGGIQR